MNKKDEKHMQEVLKNTAEKGAKAIEKGVEKMKDAVHHAEDSCCGKNHKK
ncbi:MAG: hypothetical protein ACRCTQ_00085 [Brevinemataceae bacterium]